jgi:hypothetical protein
MDRRLTLVPDQPDEPLEFSLRVDVPPVETAGEDNLEERTVPISEAAIAAALAAGEDAGELAQRVAETHLAACQESLWAEDSGEQDVPESPASAPFCGCDTCLVREILYASWSVIEASTRRDDAAGAAKTT